jgi:LysM repeat protein
MSFNRKLQMGLLLAAFVALGLYGFVPAPAQAQDATPTPFIIVITATPSPSAPSVVVVSSSASGAPCSPSVVVKPGDDLYRIALAAGTSWPVLQALNHIPNPNLIYVGETICLPASSAVNPGPTATPIVDQTGTIQALTTTPTPSSTATIPVIVITPTIPVVYVPPVSVIYPTIGLNTYHAGSGHGLDHHRCKLPGKQPA